MKCPVLGAINRWLIPIVTGSTTLANTRFEYSEIATKIYRMSRCSEWLTIVKQRVTLCQRCASREFGELSGLVLIRNGRSIFNRSKDNVGVFIVAKERNELSTLPLKGAFGWRKLDWS
jgi:hypothetical protein